MLDFEINYVYSLQMQLVETKICSKCKEIKVLSLFYKDSQKKSGYRPDCKVCSDKRRNPETANPKMKAWRRANPEYVLDMNLRSTFGITLVDFNTMRNSQNFCCAVCSRNEKEFSRRLNVDHCHTTGKVRQLLCGPCNTALGLLRENLQTIESLKSYIMFHKEPNNAIL